MRKSQRPVLALGAAVLLLAAGCGGGKDLVLGATTTLQDTGLLDELVRAFEKESGYRVAAVTPLGAGSGQVLELSRRGEGAGTHVREMAIWKEAGVDPRGQPWYQESATGQGQNLLIASDKGAYTLVDSATFAVFQERVDLLPYVVDNRVMN